MAGRYRERQYQLAAEKRNEAYLRHNYYKETARYFERETGIARHYNSWNSKQFVRDYDDQSRGKLEGRDAKWRKKRLEQLPGRRNKLRILLKEEDENCRRELAELIGNSSSSNNNNYNNNNNKGSRGNDVKNSLDYIKRKLMEKRMEQDLYLPVTCRRLRSYFTDPRPTMSSSIINNDNSNNNSYNNNNHRSKNKSNKNSNGFAECFHLKDKTNIVHSKNTATNTTINKPIVATITEADRGINNRTNSTYGKCENNIDDTSNWNDHRTCIADDNNDLFDRSMLARNRKYSARYARRSLENTNVRPGNDDMLFDNLSRRLQGTKMAAATTMTTTTTTVRSGKMAADNIDEDKENLNLVDQVDDSSTTTTTTTKTIKTTAIDLLDQEKEGKEGEDEDTTAIVSEDLTVKKDYTLNRTEQEITTNDIANDKQDINDHCDYERERGYPWMRMDPNVKNLSEKMYLYLTYRELKDKIDDLLKKEESACQRQRWDDAIRLRDMKNELELIREKKIFNMKGLTMDEDIRDKALKNIDNRERELALRADACTDSSMYSDGAKVLWEKWVKEDERFIIKDASTQREILMKVLEEEFQNLAIEDRERIAKTYRSVFNNLHLENRHHLNANLVKEAKSISNATGGEC